jgi:uncharacterized protein YbjT (DUF2867 family)
MSKPLVAIITGNSNSGSYCIEELFGRLAGKVNVRAAFRSEEKAKPYREKYPQLEVVTGVDATKPETLASFFKGTDSALVVTSEDLLVKLGNEKGIKWTALRGGNFMENFLDLHATNIKTKSTYFGTNLYTPYIDTRDIGRSAAACLVTNGDEHNRKVYDMNGPELLSGEETAKVFSKVLGREIKFQEVDLHNLPPHIREVYEFMEKGGKGAMPFKDDVKRLTGQNGTLEDFLTRHISHFQ